MLSEQPAHTSAGGNRSMKFRLSAETSNKSCESVIEGLGNSSPTKRSERGPVIK